MLSLKQLFALFKKLVNPATEHNNRLIFFNCAVQSLGTDASPNDVAPDEYGCAETVNAIHEKAFGFPIGGDVSTYRLYAALKVSPYFINVEEPLEGDVLISPTGYRSDYVVDIPGHVGIVGEKNAKGVYKIMSNSSNTGTFEENYTMDTWKKRWVKMGGYAMRFYRRV